MSNIRRNLGCVLHLGHRFFTMFPLKSIMHAHKQIQRLKYKGNCPESYYMQFILKFHMHLNLYSMIIATGGSQEHKTQGCGRPKLDAPDPVSYTPASEIPPKAPTQACQNPHKVMATKTTHGSINHACKQHNLTIKTFLNSL